MNFSPYLTFFGSIVSLIGLSIVVLALVFLRQNRIKNAVTGIIFTLLGLGLVWATFQGTNTIQLNIGIPDHLTGFLLFGIVASLTFLKMISIIIEGSRRLKDKSLSPFLAFYNKFGIIVGVIIGTWVCILTLIAVFQYVY